MSARRVTQHWETITNCSLEYMSHVEQAQFLVACGHQTNIVALMLLLPGEVSFTSWWLASAP